jgi:hypothetical protein
MSNVVPIPSPAEPPNARASARGDTLLSAIKVMFGELSLTEQERLLSDLTEILRPIPAPRAGDVLGAVIHLFPKQNEWTVQELIKRLEAGGIEHTPKEVYNALGYLTRKQKIQRTGHGRYSIGGLPIPIVTSDELGGEPSRIEEHDAN